MDQEVQRRIQNRKRREKRRRIRILYAKICRALLALIVIFLMVWFVIGMGKIVQGHTVRYQDGQLSSAQERKNLYESQNQVLLAKDEELGEILKQYQNRMPQDAVYEEVSSLQEWIVAYSEEAERYEQYRESYAEEIRKLLVLFMPEALIELPEETQEELLD